MKENKVVKKKFKPTVEKFEKNKKGHISVTETFEYEPTKLRIMRLLKNGELKRAEVLAKHGIYDDSYDLKEMDFNPLRTYDEAFISEELREMDKRIKRKREEIKIENLMRESAKTDSTNSVKETANVSNDSGATEATGAKA